MIFNIHSGRLRHTVTFYKPVAGQDEYGDPLPDVLVKTVKADVQVKSGRQLSEYGTAITSEVITILCRYHESIHNSGLVAVWHGKKYVVQHAQPDDQLRGIIVTAIRDGKDD